MNAAAQVIWKRAPKGGGWLTTRPDGKGPSVFLGGLNPNMMGTKRGS